MDAINKTLYIPLYGKAYVSQRGLFIQDKTAEEIWQKEGFLLTGKAKSKWLAYTMGIRAAVFDRWTENMLVQNPGAVVLHLGCGLDSRARRVKQQTGDWYDVDFPAVIAERERYFAETEEYHMLGADLRQMKWLDQVEDTQTAIVVMEGVSMYLQMQELQALMKRLGDRFRRIHLLMDTYTAFAAKASRYKNPIKTVGVSAVYGFDRPEEAAQTGRLRYVRELDLAPEDMILQLPKGEQGFFRTVFAGKTAKKIYRLYAYEA